MKLILEVIGVAVGIPLMLVCWDFFRGCVRLAGWALGFLIGLASTLPRIVAAITRLGRA